MNLNATLIGQLIAFALFVWFCMKFVWPPIINAIETRQSQIANALASAEAAKKEQADTKNLVEQELLSAKVQAQEILDARSLYPNSSLAHLYDETAMPGELRKAHQKNDVAVMKAYGMIKKVNGKDKLMTESETMSKLFEMYEQITSKK